MNSYRFSYENSNNNYKTISNNFYTDRSKIFKNIENNNNNNYSSVQNNNINLNKKSINKIIT